MSAVPARLRNRIHQLWDELADYGAARCERALLHALRGLAELVDAQQASWLCAVRMGERDEAVPGWRAAAARALHAEPDSSLSGNRKQIDSGAVDPNVIAGLRGQGRFRVHFQHELAAPEPSAPHGNGLQAQHIQDVAYMVTPVGEDVESWIALQRIGPDKEHFGAAERAALEYAGRALAWFHRPIVLQHGLLLANKPLMPTERRVLAALLAGGSESAIAAELGLTAATVHTYATRIFRKFNVKGRAGLTALWLHQPPSQRNRL